MDKYNDQRNALIEKLDQLYPLPNWHNPNSFPQEVRDIIEEYVC